MIKRLMLFILLTFSLVVVVSASVAAVDVIDPVCKGVETSDIPAACRDNQSGQSGNVLFGPSGLVTKITNALSVVLGVVAVIVIMISGVRFIAANGDPATITAARTSIIFALVGLVVAAIAQVIVQVVLKKVGG